MEGILAMEEEHADDLVSYWRTWCDHAQGSFWLLLPGKTPFT